MQDSIRSTEQKLLLAKLYKYMYWGGSATGLQVSLAVWLGTRKGYSDGRMYETNQILLDHK